MVSLYVYFISPFVQPEGISVISCNDLHDIDKRVFLSLSDTKKELP